MSGQEEPRPIFLERRRYRRRRLGDAARALPILGLVLLLVPVIWSRSGTSTAATLVYVFAVWVGLIAAAALMARFLRPNPDEDS